MMLTILLLLAGLGQQPASPPGASLRGTITDADTTKPLRMARVTATNPATRQAHTTQTGADGRFEFRDLPAAKYEVSVAKARYAVTPWRAPIDVTAGARIEGIDIALPRSAAIRGRLTDEFGDPLEDAYVMAARQGYDERGPTLVSVGTAVTDDAGHYRIPSLQPGEYLVVATERSEGFGSEPDADIGFLRTAYPGAATLRDARAIAVRAGQELTGIDFALVPARAVKISGRVFTSNQQTASAAWLVLQPIGETLGSGVGGDARSGADGSFLFPAVAPGRYEMHARLQRQPHEGAIIPVTIAGDDITGWDLYMTPGGRVRGRIVLPDGTTDVQPAKLNLSMVPATDTFTFGTGFGGPVKADGTFEADFLLGARVIRVRDLPPGWFVERITRGAEDLTDTVIKFQRDEVVDGVEIHLAKGAPVLTGQAHTTDGKPSTQYSVVAFSEDPAKWDRYSRYVSTARADDKGQFTIDGLPPGRYHVAAVTELAPFQWIDRAFLQSLTANATEVTLERGGRAAVTLKVSDR